MSGPISEARDELEAVRRVGMFDLLPDRQSTAVFLSILALLLVAWLGVNAAWGMASPSATLISRWEQRLLPLRWWLGAAVVGLAAAGRIRGSAQHSRAEYGTGRLRAWHPSWVDVDGSRPVAACCGADALHSARRAHRDRSLGMECAAQ